MNVTINDEAECDRVVDQIEEMMKWEEMWIRLGWITISVSIILLALDYSKPSGVLLIASIVSMLIAFSIRMVGVFIAKKHIERYHADDEDY